MMKMMKKIIVLVISLHLATVAFPQGEQSAVMQNVSVEEFKKLMDTRPDAVIVDLRTPDEIAKGKIAGSIAIDFFGQTFEPSIGALDRNKVYLLYCGSGSRSGETSELMNKMGFKTLYNLEGGFRQWVKRKMPVASK